MSLLFNAKIKYCTRVQVIAERKLYHERTGNRYLKNLENKEAEAEDVEVFGSM